MKLAYCVDCKPPIVIAAGPLRVEIPHRHTVDEKVHKNIKFTDVPHEGIPQGKKADGYLKALEKKYKTKLR